MLCSDASLEEDRSKFLAWEEALWREKAKAEWLKRGE